MAANFLERQRESLGLSRTEIAARIGTTAEAVRQWEADKGWPARVTISVLAKAYKITEQKMGEEVMAIRRRVEARELATTAK